jgi:hypothetical protein
MRWPVGAPSDRRSSWAALFVGVAILVAVTIVAPRPARADWATDCTAPTVVYGAANPPPTNLDVPPAVTVLFADGTFSGFVNASGGTICVDEAAAFDPGALNGAARLFVRGSALMPPLAVGDGALLDNEGVVRFLPQVNTNGIAEVFNRAGATILVDAPGLALGPGVTVTNDGEITVDGFVNMNGPGPTVTNNNELNITGALNVTGTFNNNDQATVGGLVTVNGGGTLANACSLVAGGLINNQSVANSGVIDLGTSALNNTGGGTSTQSATAITSGGNFTNDGTVTGTGQYLFSGTTSNQGTVSGTSAATPITFFDTTPTGSQIFDVELGTITNTVRQAVTAPPPGSCAALPPTTTTTTTNTTTTTTSLPSTTTTSVASTTTVPATTTTSTSTPVPTTRPNTTTTVTTTTTTVGGTTTTVASGAGGGSLPTTGGDPELPFLFGVLVVAVGGLLVLFGRRARHGET